MKKSVTKMEVGKVRFATEQQCHLGRNWCSLGTRALYWTGSPWCAFKTVFQKDQTI